MKKNDIIWMENGWTVIENADADAHTLEISCFSQEGTVIEVRKRHNDGEEERLKAKLDGTHTLPMTLSAFRSAVEKGELKLK